MTINEFITIYYDSFSGLCYLGIVTRSEVVIGSEDLDILHNLIIRWIKKYKNKNIENDKLLFERLKIHFLYEKNKYSKMYKSNDITYTEYPDDI